MYYYVSRGGQNYGPYTLADLERYLQTGHLVNTDLVKSDEMPDWVALSAILRPTGPAQSAVEYDSNVPAGVASSGGEAPALEPFSRPPNLHWALVLLFDLLTGTFFQVVWNVVVAVWMRRVQPNSRALFYYAAGYGLVIVYFWLQIPTLVAAMHHVVIQPPVWVRLVGVLSWVGRLVARFSMKRSLEEHYNTVEPIGLRLNGILVFFFGGLYLQWHLNQINDLQTAMRYGGPRY